MSQPTSAGWNAAKTTERLLIVFVESSSIYAEVSQSFESQRCTECEIITHAHTHTHTHTTQHTH